MNPATTQQIPVVVKPAMLFSQYVAKPGSTVDIHAEIKISIVEGEMETGGIVNLAFVVDTSYSTFGFLPFLQEALIESINLVPPGSQIAGISFSNYGNLFQPMAPIEQAKSLFIQKVDAMVSAGGTNMGDGIAKATDELSKVGAGEKVLVLFTDGATGAPDDCLRIAEHAKAQGIIIYAIGLCIAQKGVVLSRNEFNPELLEKIAGANYVYIENPEKDIVPSFQAKVLRASKIGITNTKLSINPVDWIEVRETSLAKPIFQESPNPLEIPVGEVIIGQENSVVISMTGKLPNDIQAGKRRGFGSVTLIGDVSSRGLKQAELGQGWMQLRFGEKPVVNPSVRETVRLVAIAKEQAAAAQALARGDVESARKSIQSARAKTQAVTDEDLIATLTAGFNQVEQDISAGDTLRAEERMKASSKKTTAPSDDDLIAALTAGRV